MSTDSTTEVTEFIEVIDSPIDYNATEAVTSPMTEQSLNKHILEEAFRMAVTASATTIRLPEATCDQSEAYWRKRGYNLRQRHKKALQEAGIPASTACGITFVTDEEAGVATCWVRPSHEVLMNAIANTVKEVRGGAGGTVEQPTAEVVTAETASPTAEQPAPTPTSRAAIFEGVAALMDIDFDTEQERVHAITDYIMEQLT